MKPAPRPLVLRLILFQLFVFALMTPVLFVATNLAAEYWLKEEYRREARYLADQLAVSLGYAMAQNDPRGAASIAQAAVQTTAVAELVLRSLDNEVFYHQRKRDEVLFSISASTEFHRESTGVVEVGFSVVPFRERLQLVGWVVGTTLCLTFLLLSLFQPWLLSRTLLWPLVALGKRLAETTLDKLLNTSLPVQSRTKELRALETTLAQVLSALGAQMEASRAWNLDLEEKVKRRTQELLKSNHDLAATIEKLLTVRTTLSRSQPMADLGHLAAGLAHELNSPLSAAISAVRTLEQDFQAQQQGESWDPLIRTLPQLSRGEKRELKKAWIHSGRGSESPLLEYLLSAGHGEFTWQFLTREPDEASENRLSQVLHTGACLRIASEGLARSAHIVRRLQNHALLSQVMRAPRTVPVAVALREAWNQARDLLRGIELETIEAPGESASVVLEGDGWSQVWSTIFRSVGRAMGSQGRIVCRIELAGTHARIGVWGYAVGASRRLAIDPDWELAIARAFLSAEGGQLILSPEGPLFLVTWPEARLVFSEPLEPVDEFGSGRDPEFLVDPSQVVSGGVG